MARGLQMKGITENVTKKPIRIMKITQSIANAINAVAQEIQAYKRERKQEERRKALAIPRSHVSRRIASKRQRPLLNNSSATPGVPLGFGIAHLLSQR